MFAKVFTQILDSSIAEDHEVRHTFEDLLKLCDLNGVVDMTHESIARRLNVPLQIVTRCITELEKPDPSSRTKDHEGRRIIRLDEHREWGWIIVNHAYYRAIASEEQRREKTRLRVEKFRAKSPTKPVVTLCNASNVMQKQKQKQKQIVDTEVPTAPEWDSAKRWLLDWNNNGADYAEGETRSAFLALQAGGWMWGKNKVADPRAALERQIQTDRDRKSPRNGDSRKKHHITGQLLK